MDQNQICARIVELIKDLVDGIENVDENVSLFDQGLDSLDMNGLLLEIEEEFDVKISDEDAEKAETVKKLAAYISST